MTSTDYDPLLAPTMTDDELAEIRQRIVDGARAYQQLGGMLPWPIHLHLSTDIPHLLGEVERLRALLEREPAGSEVEEQWAVRWYLPDGGTDEHDCWGNAHETAEQRARRLATNLPRGAVRGEAIRRRIYVGPWEPVEPATTDTES